MLRTNVTNTPRWLVLIIIVLSLLGATGAEAARVARTKGRAVEIELSGGDDFVKGDKVRVVSGGKLVGRMKISRIKGKKAIAKLEKGRAPIGATVSLAGGGGSKTASTGESDGTRSDLIVGVLLGFDLDSQSVKASSTDGRVSESLSMSGMGFSGKAYADMSLSDTLGVIGRFGLETFKVTGQSRNTLCSNSTTTNCETSIMYVSGDLLFRYNFSPGTWNPYAAAGLGIYFPMSKKTNILDETKIASTTIFLVGGGVNWVLNDLFIPISLEYGMFPPSNQVSTNFIALRGGVGWTW